MRSRPQLVEPVLNIRFAGAFFAAGKDLGKSHTRKADQAVFGGGSKAKSAVLPPHSAFHRVMNEATFPRELTPEESAVLDFVLSHD